MPHRFISPRTTSPEELGAIVRIMGGANNIIVQGFDGVITEWSAGCENMYGWMRDEAVGKAVDDLLATQFPESIEEIHRQLRENNSWQGEITHRHKDGYEVYVASRCMVVNLSDGEAVIVQTNNDISDLKLAQSEVNAREAHLRSILATVPEAMIVINERGIVISFSTAAEKLFGIQADDICGRNISNLMPNPDRDAHDGYLSRYIRTGERRIIGYGRVVTGQRADGSKFPMELHVGETTANGERIFTGFVRDLTSRYKIEEDLRQAQKMEAVGQLTGGIAHDFNNLLTVISGNLEMIEAKLPEGPLSLLLREAQDAAGDGAKLTEQLLAFGRRQPLNPTLADLGQLVSGFSDLLRRTLGENIDLKTVIVGSNHNVLVDSSQLQNALLNIALNARDAMPRGGSLTTEIKRVYLDADYAKMYPQVRTGDFVLISVTDTGVGMSDEVKEHAFEPFFTTKDVGSGTGLGLSMVYGFVKQSGGHLQLYSEVGRGTTIRIYLPWVQAAAAKIEVPDTRSDSRDVLPGGAETVLVVEDDARVRRVAVARLSSMGYKVIEVGNAQAALEILAEDPTIALLFTDIVMPGGMTGDELAKEARVMRSDLKILFTSGYAEPGLGGREFATPGSWLRKPYTAKDLAVRVRELLD
ncbi:sensor histidine kinase FixL-like protein (plasmid) [Rhizobium gallicum bv. gallicum R602sp]|uniref:Sensor protein FixL n=1 Tax=Rhizobium gallicum bv. gallicum R602sp TaxID=1041138 RepID=A0A0B4XI54_9HYPH|nr:PAS domain-containing sensor histidine kinase [Rhizobium gallicum]AJD46112.1 sensor histidine kinase FixL-like protein [Rhizobium gallicum bv. gallicum R602sp]